MSQENKATLGLCSHFASLLGATDTLSSSADGLSKLVEQGGKSPLALTALAVVLTAFLALWFFKNALLAVKLTIFSVLLVIGTTFAVAYYRQVFPHHHDTKPKPDLFANFNDEFEVILAASTSFFDSIRSKPIKATVLPADIKAYAPTHWITPFPYAMITQTDAKPDDGREYTHASYEARTADKLTFSEANKLFETARARLQQCLKPELGWKGRNLDDEKAQSELANPSTSERWVFSTPNDTRWSILSGKNMDIFSVAELTKEPSKSGDFKVSLTLTISLSDHPADAKN
jgi:hypothetical protein